MYLNRKGILDKNANFTVSYSELKSNGEIEIQFNTPIRKPCFLNKALSDKRLLKKIDKEINLNVKKDLLKCRYILNSDVDPSKFKYSLKLKSWDKNKIRLITKFENPLSIS